MNFKCFKIFHLPPSSPPTTECSGHVALIYVFGRFWTSRTISTINYQLQGDKDTLTLEYILRYYTLTPPVSFQF